MNEDDAFEYTSRQQQLEKYYGGKALHCWACGSRTFFEVALRRASFLGIPWGPRFIRLTCQRCKGENDHRPGTIRPSEQSSYVWVWVGKR